VSSTGQHRLHALYKDLQAELEARLGTARRNLDHPGAKGDATEGEWSDLPATYLPRRYQVSKGFVIDSMGELSDEIDIIVHDRHFSPLLFHRGQTCYVPAESVYAILEVKQELSQKYVVYAGEKAASVRRLKRTSVAIPHAGGIFPPRPVTRILAGILTSAAGWVDPSESLQGVLAKLPTDQQLDIGCAAKGLGFRVAYGTDTKVESSAPDQALVFLILNLLSALQSVGSVSAMDYDGYLKALTPTP
jgi:hypothetical protein